MTSCLLTWKTISSQKRVYSSRKEFAPMRANSVFQELTFNEVRGKQENDKIVSPKSVPIHFK